MDGLCFCIANHLHYTHISRFISPAYILVHLCMNIIVVLLVHDVFRVHTCLCTWRMIQKTCNYTEMYNECLLEIDNCEQECIDTASSYVCSCYDGYTLRRNGASCIPYCSETFTSQNGSFQTPSWPEYYPEDFDCKWIIDLSDTSVNATSVIVFIVNTTAYGMLSNCSIEYIEFFDGISANSSSLGRYCGRNPPPALLTSGLQATVVFHAHTEHPNDLQGVRVTYNTTGTSYTNCYISECDFVITLVQLLSAGRIMEVVSTSVHTLLMVLSVPAMTVTP